MLPDEPSGEHTWTRAKSWTISGLALFLALAVIFGVVLLPALTRATPLVRGRALDALNRRFNSEVTLATLEVKAFPSAGLTGSGLVFRHRSHHDGPPLIEIPEFSATAGVLDLWNQPLRLRTVELEGLVVRIPPGGMKLQLEDEAVGTSSAGDERAPRIVVDRLRSRDALLEIESRNPSRLPRRFEIHDLEMRAIGRARGAPYSATLTNPTPHGLIRTEGVFGPWQADQPSATPVRGSYEFDSANLGTIKGIGGILSSSGSYDGVLERITVSGRTHTPDFSLDIGGRSLPLETTFDAVVDGTSGDTWLERVDGMLAGTAITARGAIVRAKDVKGRHIALDVTIDDGQLEDVLALAIRSDAPLTGRMTLAAKLLIPAGEGDVIERLRLDGSFDLAEARFASFDIQRRVDALSRRGRGDTSSDGPSVVSRLRGRFVLDDTTLTFSSLSFGVPGATVQLAGTYGVRSERLDFQGDLLLDAGLRQTTSGWRAIVAALAQPLFRRPGGGSKLPIRVSGSRSKPSFGLDVKRALLPG